MKSYPAILAIYLCVAGCATGYQAKSFTGGFSEVRLNETTYKINVEGNGYTSSDRAANIALLRAADLTLQAGYDAFLVVSGNTQQNYAGTTPITTNVVGTTVITTGGDAVTKPSSDVVITMLRKTDPAYARALDARMVSAQLKAQLHVQPPPS